VHPETVRRRLVAGEIYGIRLGSTWRIPAQELDRLLDGRPSLSKGVLDDDDALIAMAIRNF
jgi:excisionase family DNA binding protein